MTTRSRSSRGMRVEMGLDNCSMLLISGTASVNDNGNDTSHRGDHQSANHAARSRNITELLESEGADWHDIVRTTCYLADFRHYDEFNEVRNAFLRGTGT